MRVPTTGNAGEAAVVLDWNVAVGAEVNAGDILVSLETAKAVVEVDAPVSGVVLDIRFAEGDDAPEHEVLLVIGEPGEAAPSPAPASPKGTSEQAPADQSASAQPAAPAAHATPEQPEASTRGRVNASPRARKLAQERQIDLHTLTGTGPFGRIVIADVESVVAPASPAAAPAAPVTPATSAAPTTPPAVASGSRVVPVRGARKVTAQRMHASLQETAQVTLTRYAKADALLAYAARLREATEAQGVAKISINDLLLFATARAVAKHPAANSWFSWDGITQFDRVNLGFAVDTGQALLVPVIEAADTLSLSALSAAAKGAIDRARNGKTTPQEMEGGTFTVSNLGGLGIHWFTPVLNPPQSCILGVGATHRGHPEGPAELPLSLTFDHRAIDGAAAATLLADIAGAIEYVDTLTAL